MGTGQRSRSISAALILIVLIVAFTAARHSEAGFFSREPRAPPLQPYNVDPAMVSVSGISAGGFMASQLGIAYSSVFTRGFGVFAGGPYDCARDQKFSACMANATPDISLPRANLARWSGNRIDDLKNLAGRRVFLWSGERDRVIGPNVVKMLDRELAGWLRPENVRFKALPGAAHTFPTDFHSAGNNPCGQSVSPFISNCGYDGAGEVLKWLYGDLKPRNDRPDPARVVSFDQAQFVPKGKGMDRTGYLYVPAACASGRQCRLHVALHGCSQGFKGIKFGFIHNTGYNKWADTNGIIVLYPQAEPDFMLHGTWSSGLLNNLAGCWDWIGWYDKDADRHGGTQLEAIVGMVKRVTSGYKR